MLPLLFGPGPIIGRAIELLTQQRPDAPVEREEDLARQQQRNEHEQERVYFPIPYLQQQAERADRHAMFIMAQYYNRGMRGGSPKFSRSLSLV